MNAPRQGTMQIAVEHYLQDRRRLGFDLTIAGQQLMRFARYADEHGHRGPLTVDLQLDWAHADQPDANPLTAAGRLEVVRPFARYYRQFEPDSAIPDPRSFGPSHRRLTPHIYTESEISDLLREAGQLRPVSGLRPKTYQTLFGLIAATGLRLSEALRLRDADVDLRDISRTFVTVHQTKFKKSRLLPVHPTTADALHAYRKVRDRLALPQPGRCFFISSDGRPLPKRTVHDVFARLRGRLGWVARGGHPQPRIHDLRHTFAVRRMQLWQQSELRMDNAVVSLCTYLGHAKVSDTYWYLTGVPDLLTPVANRFERFACRTAEVNHE
jgi:integrase